MSKMNVRFILPFLAEMGCQNSINEAKHVNGFCISHHIPPLSFILTNVCFPLDRLVTLTIVPSLMVRCAAVNLFISNISPLAVLWP